MPTIVIYFKLILFCASCYVLPAAKILLNEWQSILPHPTQKILAKTNLPLSLIRYGTHTKRRIQKLFYCYLYICCRGKVLTEPLPSNDRSDTYTSTEANMRNHKCGGGIEYIQRDPASRRRRRKGSLKSETLKYVHESQRTRTRERLRCRGPATHKNRPVLLSERAAQKKKTVTLKK
jgi:hypothetical protein